MKVLLLLCAGLAWAQSTEEAAVRVPLENYLKGLATGQGSYMRKAFLSTAHIEGIREGKFTSWTLDEYVALFKGTPSPEESKRKRWIEKLSVTGTAAMAELRSDYPSIHFTDFLVLLKVDGDWKIANKVYTFQAKSKP